eukprot:m.105810 g.105810  ORF g.105810 m.105810 type:complete len:717 (-) comp13287_c1_seq4:93-2243(-)
MGTQHGSTHGFGGRIKNNAVFIPVAVFLVVMTVYVTNSNSNLPNNGRPHKYQHVEPSTKQQQQHLETSTGSSTEATTATQKATRKATTSAVPVTLTGASHHSIAVSCSKFTRRQACYIAKGFVEPHDPSMMIWPKANRVSNGTQSLFVDVTHFELLWQASETIETETFNEVAPLVYESFARLCSRMLHTCASGFPLNEYGQRAERPAPRKPSDAAAAGGHNDNDDDDDANDDDDDDGEQEVGGGVPESGAQDNFAWLTKLVIEIEDELAPLDIGVNESYALHVPATKAAQLRANTVWGAMHGLESFYQLVARHPPSNRPVISNVPISVQDEPKQLWRGLLLDTSRHYISRSTIRKLLDMMSLVKYNVLHWHIVDDQSFPLESKKYPQLAAKGAWALGGQRAIYTQDHVRDIVAYARNRSITVIPEVDIPGHASSWGLGIPEVTLCDTLHQPLNPLFPNTTTIVAELFEEILDMFPSKYIHIGGDEFDPKCWTTANVPELQDTKDIQTIVDAAFEVITNRNRIPVMWNDLIESRPINVPSSSIVQLWKCWGAKMGLTRQVLQANQHNAIQSTCMYFDFDKSWKEFYMDDSARGATTNLDRLWGSEGAIWTERIDGSNFFCRVFPRMTALAERFWSYKPQNTPTEADVDEMYPRFLVANNRIAILGVPQNILTKPSDAGFCPLLPESKSHKEVQSGQKPKVRANRGIPYQPIVSEPGN